MALLESENEIESLKDFVSRVTPRYPMPRHVECIADLFERSRHEPIRVTISMPPRHCKLLADSTPVLTPTGWSKHGDLKVGSEVYSLDGSITKVTYVTEKQEANSLVTFSDGEQIKCNPEHLWTVYARGQGYVTLETRDMEGKLYSGVSRNGSPRARFGLDYCAPLSGVEQELPFEPYFLGLWLGNGSADSLKITCHKKDEPYYRKFLEERGHSFGARWTHKDTGVVQFMVQSQAPKGQGIWGYFHGNKVLPDCYLTATLKQRRDLVAGLIDSDGYVDKNGRAVFINTNKRLIDQVCLLISTLGYRPSVTKHEPCGIKDRQTISKQICYRVQWTPHDGVPQGYLPRKNYSKVGVRRRRFITDIVRCEPELGHCIQVDHPSHLYLVGKTLVPTHNTESGMNGLAWRLFNDPATRHAFCSYSADLARDKSGQIRNRFLEAGGELDPKNTASTKWYTKQEGGLIAGGVGGPLTGFGITGIGYIDDPIKNREDAESRVMRDKLWDWYQSTFCSRLEPGSSVIVVATRWHPDDLIGRLHSDEYEHEQFENINLPAVFDLNGNPADERVLDESGFPIPGKYRSDVRPLWKDYWPLEELEKKRSAGEYDWWALYQGMPQPKGSAVFRNDPSRFNLVEFKKNQLSKGGYRIIISVDPAATASTRADYSVAAVHAAIGYGEQMQTYLLYVQRGQWTIPALCRNLRALQSEWGVPMAIEAVGAFKAVKDILAESDPNLIFLPVELKGDKFARSQPYASAWNEGRCHIPYDASWANDWISEHASFTGVNDKNDDQVDAGAHGFSALLRSQPPRRLPGAGYVGPYG